jgi:hypothetical protein
VSAHRPVEVNLAGFVESPEFGATPYRIDLDGKPYVPVGDGGIVLGVELGDGVFEHAGDHVAPGVTLTHPDQAARHGLTTYSCAGNEAVVRGGVAAGATGRVLGKRGEAGRVIVVFARSVLSRLAPGDPVMVRTIGQGSVLPAALAGSGAQMVNAAPGFLEANGVKISDHIGCSVRGRIPSKLVGNGIGRPVQMWDVDLSLTPANAGSWGLSSLSLGDLVAVDDLDVRNNIGFRSGWTTVGVIVHGGSPMPGHGPGLMPVLCAPSALFDLSVAPEGHRGISTIA